MGSVSYTHLDVYKRQLMRLYGEKYMRNRQTVYSKLVTLINKLLNTFLVYKLMRNLAFHLSVENYAEFSNSFFAYGFITFTFIIFTFAIFHFNL